MVAFNNETGFLVKPIDYYLILLIGCTRVIKLVKVPLYISFEKEIIENKHIFYRNKFRSKKSPNTCINLRLVVVCSFCSVHLLKITTKFATH